MNQYVVATIKPWNIAAFRRHTPTLPGRWHLISSPSELTYTRIAKIKPRYIFFPHWSWRVPDNILDAFECVCFHMTDLPYGRGGSPLQNLIVRGHSDTFLSALRMSRVLDAGPIYLKTPLDLSGRAQAIFERAADLIFHMIASIIEKEPAPRPQKGKVVKFPRRNVKQSRMPKKAATMKELYDHVRMLDAETYPRAFLDYGDFRFEFSNAELAGREVIANVVVRRRD